VRADMTKVYNLRLPEPALLKLKYIAEHTPDSMQKFCLDARAEAVLEAPELEEGAQVERLPIAPKPHAAA
jgi:hypothetical protein